MAVQTGFELIPSAPTTKSSCVQLPESATDPFDSLLNCLRIIFYLDLVCCLHPLHQIVSGLKPLPSISAITERLIETNCHLGRDFRSTIHAVLSWIRPAWIRSKPKVIGEIQSAVTHVPSISPFEAQDYAPVAEHFDGSITR